MVVIDATILLLLLRPESGGPMDSNTGQPVTQVKERIDFLIETLEKSRARLIVPTPALSEVLVRAEPSDAPRIVEEINKAAVFHIASFDALAAIEVAAMTRTAISRGDKKSGSQETWAKVKYDRQIVAIARVAQASVIYSDDRGIRALAKDAGIRVVGIADLPLPPKIAQPE
jgi:predicted nucleic acid-binding protein